MYNQVKTSLIKAMDNKAKDIKLVKITELKPHPKNPNKHNKDQKNNIALFFTKVF